MQSREKHPLRREPMPSYSEIVRNTFRAGYTYRRYGQNGELKRRMIHRFPAEKLKCDGSMADVLAENITRSNSLLDRLSRRGKP